MSDELTDLRRWVEKGIHRWNCSRTTLKHNGGRCNCGLTALQKKWGLKYEGFADPDRPKHLTKPRTK